MSSIDQEIIKTVVSKAVSSNSKILSHSIEFFSKNRNGIMGNHYVLTVDIEDELNNGCVRKLNFFVKTPPDSPIMRDMIVDEWVAFEEVHFFNKIYPIMMENCTINEKWSPACYLAKSNILIFEDLRSQGYAILQDSIFDEEHIKSVLITLARFHAASIVAEKRLGERLDKIYPDAFREKIFTDVGKGGRSNKLGFETLKLLAERFNLDSVIIPKILQRLYELVKPKTDSFNVICHGDLWRSNIMFNDSATSSRKCILVDYQMLRYASPSVDVAMLIYVHTTPELRTNSEIKLLEHYYSIFKESLLSSHINHDNVPTYEDICEDYDKCKLIGMAYAAMKWPKIVFRDVLNDPVKLENWYFHNRIDIYNKAMDEDSDYERKMKEHLVELCNEGKRILNL